MNKIRKISTALLIVTLMVGCNSSETKVKELEQKVSRLEKQVSSLELDNTIRQIGGIAFLTPGSDGYSVIRFDLGSLTVSLDDIQPYANGSKAKLRIGNLVAGTVTGLKATIEWGPVDDKGLPDNSKAKSKGFSFTESLRPASWTTVNVVLEGLPPADLGFIRISEVGHTGVQLAGR
jgi:hypothetical protein